LKSQERDGADGRDWDTGTYEDEDVLLWLLSDSGAYEADAKNFTHVKSIDKEDSPRTQESGIRTTAHDNRGVSTCQCLRRGRQSAVVVAVVESSVPAELTMCPLLIVMQSLVVYRISTRACHSS